MARRIAVLQGEIWNADFEPIIGHEQGGFRPALVVSSNQFNQLPFNLCVVASITKVERKTVFEVSIDPHEVVHPVPSVAHRFTRPTRTETRTGSTGDVRRRAGDIPATHQPAKDPDPLTNTSQRISAHRSKPMSLMDVTELHHPLAPVMATLACSKCSRS